jgi:hypothetical protein
MRLSAVTAKLTLLLAILSGLATAQVVLTGNSFTSSATPKTNYSNSIALVVCAGSNTYLQFSFAGLPAGLNGSNISGANVVVYVDAVIAAGTIDVYTVKGSWSQGTITYNNAPALGSKILSAVPISTAGNPGTDGKSGEIRGNPGKSGDRRDCPHFFQRNPAFM